MHSLSIIRRPLLFLTPILLGGLHPAGVRGDSLDFSRDIRPILAENCFSCHGFDEKARKADLRLDLREPATAVQDGIAAIVPGNPEKSEVWRRITSTKKFEQMPPPRSGHKLTEAEKKTLRRWIEEGAPYSRHWAFEPPKRPPVPDLPAKVRPDGGNVIDQFVRARLLKEGIAPANQADRATLIRRLHLDLLGLPPAAAEVEAFVRDEDPRAYEKLVDRLLASPHFGERLALDWLDAARYADTNGFSIDGGRHMWLWRDWVIQAFNDGKPYDRFLLEQLAGDLLPNRTEADLIASGFQRNNMVTHEGGTIPAENLTNYNADRVKTLGEAVLGLTLGCGQCHDHKYDPISQKDYYRLFAFFNTLADRGLDGNAGVNPGPSITAKTVLRTDEIEPLQKRIADLKARLAVPDPKVLATWVTREREKLAQRGRDFALHPVKVLKVSTPNRGAGFDIDADGRVRITGGGGLAAFDVAMALPKTDAPITGLRAIFHPLSGGWGHGHLEGNKKGTFILTALCATADIIPGDQVNLHKLRDIARYTASTWHPRFPASGCFDPRNESGWSPDPQANGPVHLTATFVEPIQVAKTPYLTAQLNFGYGQNLIPGLIELAAVTGIDDGTELPDDILAFLKLEKRNPEQERHLWDYCAAHTEAFRRERIDLANLEERLTVLTRPFPTMVMNVAPKPRKTFFLHRGDYSQPREEVQPGTPDALHDFPKEAPANRLGLARWIVDRDNPLTARVAVNRFWRMLFGTGIVGTPADFGTRGELPSHPELLDWLAVEFMDSGWDVKRLLKLMVTSATYKQDAAAPAALLERDPGNRLLARGARFRLPAELIRDSALKVSGLLVPRIGGPSVKPYLPGDLWREVSHYGSTPATAQTFVQDHGEKLYRRSLYTYWKRAAPPPNMTAFDAPNREVCVVERPNTTTPLQALVLLNDLQFVEASRAFAERMLAHPGDEAAKLRWAFLETLSRNPSEKELAVLARALARHRVSYRDDLAAARAYLSVGESPRNESIPPAEHAAWAQVAATLLNLNETITRQ